MLAKYLHFGRTAKLLNLSQPALTKQIVQLEHYFGMLLFDRNRKGTKLTTFGQQLLKEAQAFMVHYEQLCQLGKKISTGEYGLLRLGYGLHAFEMVPRLIVQFRRSSPGIELTLNDLSTHEQLEALRVGQLDIGFVKLTTPTEFNTLPVVEEQLSLVTPEQSSLSRIRHLEECADIPFVIISRERSPVLHNQILLLCGNRGFYPRIIQEVSEVATILTLVKAGLGVTILPPSFCGPGFSGLLTYSLDQPDALWSVYAAWRKGDANPALDAFLKLLHQEICS
jgi:DNA-binding transcriptional LysR family regulator